jgi:two-component system sensor histidine kinase PhoQ
VLHSALAVLAAFVLMTGLALDQAFRDSVRAVREERLLAQAYLLMASAEGAGDTLILPEYLSEPRFGLPDSGLYAAVLDAAGQPVWRSRSAVSVGPPLEGALLPGEQSLELRRSAAGGDFLVQRYGVRWAIGPAPAAYTFVVAEDLTAFRDEMGRLRTALAGWLGGTALLTLAALLAVLRWGLAPLRQVAAEVAAVESGGADRLLGEYPEELAPLTDNLNALLAHERARQKRLDDALGDLAHSLKTPLAVVRGALRDGAVPSGPAALVDEQVTRMERIVEHQLQRARAGAAAVLGGAVPVAAVAERLGASLTKVYREKGVRLRVAGDREACFRGTEVDLMEVLGNLMDNAFKWARREVRVGVARTDGRLEILVDDDGPGVAPEQARRLLQRGARGDEAVPGHGIGLAVARDICEAYGGSLALDRGDLGGARVRLGLPA